MARPLQRSKRVTFCEDVILNEFVPNSIILRTKITKKTKNNDVRKERIDDETTHLQQNKIECNNSEANDTQHDDNDRCNNGNPEKDYDERRDNSSNEKLENSEDPQQTTSTASLIQCKWAIEAAIDVGVGVDTESEHSKFEKAENVAVSLGAVVWVNVYVSEVLYFRVTVKTLCITECQSRGGDLVLIEANTQPAGKIFHARIVATKV